MQLNDYLQLQTYLRILLFIQVCHSGRRTGIQLTPAIIGAFGEHALQYDVRSCKHAQSETTDYTYDTLDRLTAWTIAGKTKTTYTYVGYNRKTETVYSLNPETLTRNLTYDYDETDRLTRTTDSVNGKIIAYAYDNNGNTLKRTDSLLPDQETTFTYDSRDQLTQTKRGPPGAEVILGKYDYNYAGMRVRHLYSDRGNIDYYYDGKSVIEERNAADNSLVAHYDYADRLLSLRTSVAAQFFHHDALGSTVNLTDAAGAIQVSYLLDPWGHIRSQSGTSVNRKIFTGHEHDANTGLVYFKARYYDPDTGRFITQDPYLGETNTPPSLHRYLYAYSNPTVYVDLEGYESVRELMGVDEKSMEAAAAKDNSWWAATKYAAKATGYTVWNGVTGGFLERQDARQEKLDRGQISESVFWKGTGIDATVSIGSQVAAGGVAGKVAGRVTAATGSKFVANTLSGGAASGFTSAVEQSGQVLTYYATDGALGQEKIDYGKIVESAGSGMLLAGGMHVVGSGVEKVVSIAKARGKAGGSTALTVETPEARLPVSAEPIGKVESKYFSEKPIEWTATRPKGTQQTYEVFQRKDINWEKIRTAGDRWYINKTNAEAATKGLAPQLEDESFATLHHLGQDARGALVEASTRYHGVGKYGQDILHSQYGKNMPHPEFPIDRKKFSVDTSEYWKWRVNNQKNRGI